MSTRVWCTGKVPSGTMAATTRASVKMLSPGDINALPSKKTFSVAADLFLLSIKHTLVAFA